MEPKQAFNSYYGTKVNIPIYYLLPTYYLLQYLLYFYSSKLLAVCFYNSKLQIRGGMLMVKKVGFTVTDKDHVESIEPFKRFVIRKHGKLHTSLGEEVSRALAHYLSCQAVNTNTNSKGKYRQDRLRRIVAAYNALPNDGSFPESLIDTAIDAKSKVGRVTKKEYLKFMLGHEMILKVKSDLFVASARAGIEPRYEKGILPQWLKEELEEVG